MARTTRSIGWLALGLLALIQTGCMLAVAGAAGAGAAAGYMYYRGLLYRDYHANLADATAAVRTSLLELQFPILAEKSDTGSGYFETRTTDNSTVRIYLDMVPSPIPVEGSLTRIGVRVGYTGDDTVSGRLLDQISRHLAPPPALANTRSGTFPGGSAVPPVPAIGVPMTPASAIGEPRPTESPAPPLAGGQRLQPVPAGQEPAPRLQPVPAAQEQPRPQ